MSAELARRSRFPARLAAALVALVVVLALAGAAAWSQRKPLARWWTLRELAQRGIAPASVEVARIDGSRLELRGLRAGAEGQLSIDAIDADYTPGLLWRGRVGALRIAGVRLTGEIVDGEPRFGGLEGRADAEGPGGGTAGAGLRLPAMPSNQLVIEDARAEISTAQGPLAVVFSLNAQDSDGKISAHGDLVARHPLAQATAKLELGARAIRSREALRSGCGWSRARTSADHPAGSIALAAQVERRARSSSSRSLRVPRADVREGQDALKLEGTRRRRRCAPSSMKTWSWLPSISKLTGGELRSKTLGFVRAA